MLHGIRYRTAQPPSMRERPAALVVVALLGASCTSALRLHGAPDLAEGVTLTINAVDREADVLNLKVRHLVNQTHFNFTSRILILDTNGSEPAASLTSAAQELINDGVMDSYMTVDYSEAYLNKTMERLGWESRDMTHVGHQGNLVYVFMLDRCPTRYLVHYDLDMVTWSAANYSWVADVLPLLKQDTRYFYATPARVGSRGRPSGQRTCESRGPFATWVAMRNFLIDVVRYNELLDELSLPQHIDMRQRCNGHHIENLLSCSVCKLRQEGVDGWGRVDLMDGMKSWVLHFPELTQCGERMASWVIRNLIDANIKVAEKPGFQAKFLHWWLDEARERRYWQQEFASWDEGSEFAKPNDRMIEEVPQMSMCQKAALQAFRIRGWLAGEPGDFDSLDEP